MIPSTALAFIHALENAMQPAVVCERVSLDEDGDIDEITAENVSVHIERMHDGHIWISIERDGEAQIVNLFTARGAKIIGTTVQETYMAKKPTPKPKLKPKKGKPRAKAPRARPVQRHRRHEPGA